MSRLILAALFVALVAACGIRGGLETPPPLMGEARQKYDEAVAKGEEAPRARDTRPGAENTPGIGTGGAQGNEAVRVPQF